VQPPQAQAGRRVVASAERHAGRQDDVDGGGIGRVRPVRHDPQRPALSGACATAETQAF